MTVSVETCWSLSKLWYPDRLQIDWQPKSEKRIQTIFDSIGLEGEFWSVGD